MLLRRYQPAQRGQPRVRHPATSIVGDRAVAISNTSFHTVGSFPDVVLEPGFYTIRGVTLEHLNGGVATLGVVDTAGNRIAIANVSGSRPRADAPFDLQLVSRFTLRLLLLYTDAATCRVQLTQDNTLGIY